jgi:hypothetical protein
VIVSCSPASARRSTSPTFDRVGGFKGVAQPLGRGDEVGRSDADVVIVARREDDVEQCVGI